MGATGKFREFFLPRVNKSLETTVVLALSSSKSPELPRTGQGLRGRLGRERRPGPRPALGCPFSLMLAVLSDFSLT